MNIRRILYVSLAVIGALSLVSCGTIIGGSRYNAHITVSNNPNAKIIYNGQVRGVGSAMIKVKRKDADKFSFSVKDDNCKEETFTFNSKTLRGWAFVGTLLGWTGSLPLSGGGFLPLPWGVGTDLITGSLWKPDINEKGVSKQDYKNFSYFVDYGKCSEKQKETTEAISDVLYLKNGGIIRGTIIEQIPNVHYKIKTKDNNVFVFKLDEIEKIVKE